MLLELSNNWRKEIVFAWHSQIILSAVIVATAAVDVEITYDGRKVDFGFLFGHLATNSFTILQNKTIVFEIFAKIHFLLKWYVVNFLEYNFQTKFYGNMPQALKSPRCRQSNPYKNVTVVPIDFGNTSCRQLVETRSPRSNSKTKLRLVSPMRKLNQTAFLSQSNQPNDPKQPQKTIISPRNMIRIQLGGRNSSKNKENAIDSSATLSKINNRSYLQSSQKSLTKVQAPVFLHSQPYPIAALALQSRASSPSNSIHINYKPSPVYVNWQSSAMAQSSRPVTTMHVRRNSPGMNISETKSNFPTELQIREENVIQQLKESYQCEINEIKKLKQEIEKNNHEIKKLLKSSRASKESTKSKTLIEDPNSQKQPACNQQISIKALNNGQPRSVVCQKQQSIHQFYHQYKEYERKENEICSKKTLINDLDFQTHQKLGNLIVHQNCAVKTEGVQAQEIIFPPLLKEKSSSGSKISQRQPKLTLNNVCQVRFEFSNRANVIQQHIDLENSIICPQQEVFKLPLKQNSVLIKQTASRPEKDFEIENFTELKKDQQKVTNEIKSLTKAVYESDVKEKKVATNSQIAIAEVKAQIQAIEANMLPVSQKIMDFQPANQEQQSKMSSSKIVFSNKELKTLQQRAFQPLKYDDSQVQSSIKREFQPNKSNEKKLDDKEQTKKPIANDEKKQNRKINNSIYL